MKKIVERGKTNTHCTQMHDHSHSWNGTGTSIQSGGVNLVLWTLTKNILFFLLLK